ncbi:hypothetical protein NEOLI_003157 [Neolecta irregularis DAH-3]|uniref:Uncharacterized protein n=1 Tax=Neolecta irregularis (strain DAH-3) TaxID=1198029 RepID=A0A1U7LJG6_NEOID|nr:hypothetical protein NEOLI_003157 [Neolecta irregularis DAH-3]|eukprot:OLL22806.1 hypothetical protein NEOLI_003157 [Neolecta irregularis DAH-3]
MSWMTSGTIPSLTKLWATEEELAVKRGIGWAIARSLGGGARSGTYVIIAGSEHLEMTSTTLIISVFSENIFVYEKHK